MQPRFQTPDGHIYEQQGGEFVLVEPSAPAPIITRPADPRAPVQLERDQVGLARDQVALETARINQRTAEQNQGQTAAQQASAAARERGILSLSNRLREVRERYNNDLSGQGIGSIWEYAPGWLNPRAGAFDDAANSMLGDLAASQGLTAQQQNTPTEVQLRFGPLIPHASDPDSRIEAKLNRLEEFIRAQGGAPTADAPQPAPPALAGPAEGLDRHQQAVVEAAPEAQQIAPADQGFRSEADPTLRGVNARVESMLRQGRPDAEIRAYLQSIGVRANADEVLEFRRRNPQYRGGYRINLETRNVPISALRQAATTLADTAPGSYTIGAANALTAGYLPELTPGDTELNRAGIDAVREQHQGSDLLGNVSGGVLATLLPGAVAGRVAPGLMAALARAPRWTALGTDLAYGAAYGSGMDPENRLRGAAEGAGIAVPAGIAARGLVRGLGNIVGGAEQQPAVQRLIDQGFVLSPAQRAAGNRTLLGATRRRVDDALTSSPILGDAITAQRTRQFSHLGRATVNEALAPISANAPRHLEGNQLIDFANQQVSDAYERALPGIRAPLDPDFIAANNAVRASAANLPQAQREVFDTIYERAVTPFIPEDGILTGQALQDIKRGLDKQILRLDRTANPADEYLSDELRNLRTVFFDWAERAAPDRVADFRAANAAFANMVRVNRAAGAAKADAIFTPNQLLGAIKANASDAQFASGGLPMQQLGQDAQSVLPSTVPDSGTAGRVLANTLGPGAAIAGTSAMPALSPLLAPYAAKTAVHLPGVDRLLQILATRRTAGLVRRGQQIRNRARLGSAAAVPVALESTAGNR